MATSIDPSDDVLASMARDHGLTVFRGPLQDVLARFFLATAGFSEDSVVVRLTADNVVPDGHFVEELAHAFLAGTAEYMNTGVTESGLPYGLGAEAFSVQALRRAYREAMSPEDREHVGPWIRRNCKSEIYRPKRSDDSDYSHLRCTIDDHEDYERIVRLFASVSDPLNVPWQTLLDGLAKLPSEAKFRVPYHIVKGRICSQFTLGTAQLGMEYGIVNDSGKPSSGPAIDIIRTAVAHGVTSIDTASSYGKAEQLLGTALNGSWGSRAQVITKLSLSGLPVQANTRQVRAWVDDQIRHSCDQLQRPFLDVLLLHRWQDRDNWEGAAWQRLLELRAERRIGVLGVSVYQPNEALSALQDAAVEHLQIPINVLDWRWEAAGVDRLANSRPEVVVHARSVLLQGILSHPASRWPLVKGFEAHLAVKKLDGLAEEFERESVTDLCLAYIRSLPWVTSSVVGCETMHQLRDNLRLSRARGLSAEQCRRLREEFPRTPEGLLNPSKWSKIYEARVTH